MPPVVHPSRESASRRLITFPRRDLSSGVLLTSGRGEGRPAREGCPRRTEAVTRNGKQRINRKKLVRCVMQPERCRRIHCFRARVIAFSFALIAIMFRQLSRTPSSAESECEERTICHFPRKEWKLRPNQTIRFSSFR